MVETIVRNAGWIIGLVIRGPTKMSVRRRADSAEREPSIAQAALG